MFLILLITFSTCKDVLLTAFIVKVFTESGKVVNPTKRLIPNYLCIFVEFTLILLFYWCIFNIWRFLRTLKHLRSNEPIMCLKALLGSLLIATQLCIVLSEYAWYGLHIKVNTRTDIPA
jgi:hypothetical protein